MKAALVLVCTFVVLCRARLDERIIGGSTAPAGRYQYMAAIYKQTPEGRFFCGGSLIDSRFILTSGQCVDGATLFTIYLGTRNIKDLAGPSLELATEEYYLHPDYNPLTLENDIGIIRLRMHVTFTSSILPIPLSTDPLADGTTVQAAGWGQTSDDAPGLSDDLKIISLSTLSNLECKITYGNQITDQMVCAANNYNGGACQGDVGGPLLYFYRGQKAYQHGVLSFVSVLNGCESPDPSLYTRTYPYLDWIRNVTSNM